MLSEAAEQFRLNDNLGHADLCEIYKTEAENVLKGLKPYPEH